MTFRRDTRGRLPFALVGVVLLVSTAAFSGVNAVRAPVADETAAERALARSQTATHLAVERATLNASARAAASPLTAPAETPMGRVLHDDPFERYLRLLVYLEVRRSLPRAAASAGSVSVTPSLPRIETPADAERAIERTTVQPVDDGRRLRVSVTNVTYALRRHDAALGRHEASVSVVVASPILSVHRRTERYEDRLDAGPLEGPGLGRRLTARLWTTTQTRGLAQYGGAPIPNVLPNRHVELQTNAAAVALQRDTFGHTAPGSEAALVWATGRIGLHDGIASATPDRRHWSEAVLDSPNAATPGAVRAALERPPAPEPARVDANETADRALVTVLEPGPDSIDAAIRGAYTIDATLVVDTDTRSIETTTNGTLPTGAALVDTTRRRTYTSRTATPTDATAPAGWRLVELAGREVTETRVVDRIYRTPHGTTHVVETTTTRYHVDVGVATRYASDPAPPRPVADGPGIRRLRRVAVDELLDSPAAIDRVATGAVTDEFEPEPRRVSIQPPADVERNVRESVLETHHRTRARSAAVNGSSSGQGSGVSALAAVIETNRSGLLDTPARYSGPDAVARTAARQAYLDAVSTELETGQRHSDTTIDTIDELLADRGYSIPRVDRLTDEQTRSAPHAAARDTGLRVSTNPAYLPVTEVTPAMASIDEPYHPLAARNVNLFTVPAGDVATGVAARLVPETAGRADLAVAARILDASTDPAVPQNETLDRERRQLSADVEAATDVVMASQVRALARDTDLSEGESAELVTDTIAEYPTTADRALAATNGTLSTQLAESTAPRTGDDAAVLAAKLRVAAADTRTRSDARVPTDAVQATDSMTRRVAREAVSRVTERAVDHAAEQVKRRALAETMADLPAGLPVAPVPGYWYATVNVWIVDVRGAYDRVEVSSIAASPAFGADGLAYTREDRPVRVDVTGNGTPEHLGRVEPVAFDVQTIIVVAVPAGPRGVGDTDGTMDERSPGWPGPEAARPPAPPARNETQTTPPSTGSP